MKKLFLSFICSFLLTSLLFCADEEMKTKPAKTVFDDVEIFSLIESEFDNSPDLFAYPEYPKVLETYLAKPKSTKSGITVFLATTQNIKILFDTGSNPATVIERLHELNIKPDDINFICITHIHPDHIGGLLNSNKNAVFANATVFIPEKELDLNKNFRASEIYGNKIKRFSSDEELIKGLKPVAAYGHTGGHTMYKLSTQNKTILFCGDIFYAPMQFAKPDIYTLYDDYPEDCIATRREILEKISDGKTIIAGTHLIYPAIGTVSKIKDGYKFTPAVSK